MINTNFKTITPKRKMSNRRFNNMAIYVGDLVEYKKGKTIEIGEVQERDGGYYVGGRELLLLTDIRRVISMGKSEE